MRKYHPRFIKRSKKAHLDDKSKKLRSKILKPSLLQEKLGVGMDAYK